MKGNTTLFKLKSLLYTSTDNQKWVFTKGQHSVKTESSLWFLFPVKNEGAVTILLLCSFSDGALYLYQVLLKYLNSFKVTEWTLRGIIPYKGALRP